MKASRLIGTGDGTLEIHFRPPGEGVPGNGRSIVEPAQDGFAPPMHKANMKKRVLFLHQPSGVGGVEFRIMNWLRGIDYEKNHVLLGFTMDVFSGRVKALGLPVECIPLTPPVKGNPWNIFFCWLRFLRRLHVDKMILVDSWFLEWPLSIVLAAWFASRGPVYMSEHSAHPPCPTRNSRVYFGFLPGIGLWWYLKILPLRMRAHLSKRVLAVSTGLKDWLVQSYGYLPEKIEVVYKGIDMSRFFRPEGEARGALRSEMGLPLYATVMVSTARLSGEKRVDRLIKAFDILAQDRPDLWLVVVGDGNEGPALQSLANASQASRRIKFFGFLEDVSPALKVSDIFVLPSDFEGLATSMLEAMATELVCVVTRTVGPSEVIEDEITGFLVPISYEGVLDGIKNALRLDKEGRRLMGSRAREAVLHIFDMRKTVPQGLDCFDIESTDQFE